MEIVFGYDETSRIRCQKTFPNQWKTSYEGAIYTVRAYARLRLMYKSNNDGRLCKFIYALKSLYLFVNPTPVLFLVILHNEKMNNSPRFSEVGN